MLERLSACEGIPVSIEEEGRSGGETAAMQLSIL